MDTPHEDEDETAGAELDWDLEERDAFLTEADEDWQAPVDVFVEADQ